VQAGNAIAGRLDVKAAFTNTVDKKKSAPEGTCPNMFTTKKLERDGKQ
jgi:hypothetical protein